VPLYRVEEVASFFPAFRREWEKPAAVEVKVCRDMTCHLRGAGQLLSAAGLPRFATLLGQSANTTICVEGTSCLGRCDRAPALLIERYPKEEHEHAMLFCGRAAGELGEVLRALADGTKQEPDTDAGHPPNTNRTKREMTGSAGWLIDPY